MTFGPFEVDPRDIARLDTAFTPFVNSLLVLESQANNLRLDQIQIAVQENAPDGGVDAVITSPNESSGLPSGISAWQFKRGDLTAAACRHELSGAKWAQELLKDGAAYRLVLGRLLVAEGLGDRREALTELAESLGVNVREGQIEVIAADQIALWASTFPALTLSPMLGGPGYGLFDFERWSSEARHQTTWVEDESRRQQIDQIRTDLANLRRPDIRIQGPSGIGKTRLAMEALRQSGMKELVAYVPDGGSLDEQVLHHLMRPKRTAILIVDECPARKHDKLAERLTVEDTIKLVTIGETDDYRLDVPVLEVGELPATQLDEFLSSTSPELTPEHRRAIVDQAGGNARYAGLLATMIIGSTPETIAELIRTRDVQQFLSLALPEGRAYFLASVLALFERVGWDGDLQSERDRLLRFAGATADELIGLERDLRGPGILERQGRYRAVTPHPLAVGLAAELWNSDAKRIIDDLLPELNREMALALFGRLSQLGSYGPARSVLSRLMSSDGPFGTLESIETHELGDFLIRMAIVAPDETASHLDSLIRAASLAELCEQTKSRRSLVWALEKLVWHSRLFERSADMLLRLALAENEIYANSATGTWISLFGAMLPATGASPDHRVVYLNRHSRSADGEARLLVARACASHLHWYEFVTVSGEVQGASLVEPRGRVATAEEAANYRLGLIEILDRLTGDHDGRVADVAVEGLVAAINPLIDDTVLGIRLSEAILRLERPRLDKAREAIRNLQRTFKRGNHTSSLAESVDRLADRLPSVGTLDQLQGLVDTEPWQFQDADEQEEFQSQVSAALAQGHLEQVLSWLDHRQLASAWHLGHSLAAIPEAPQDQILQSVLGAVDLNLLALAGYLWARVDAGDDAAFDAFLGDLEPIALSPRQQLALTINGPVTEQAKERALQLVDQVSVSEGAASLFRMSREISSEEVTRLLRTWSGGMQTQRDYNLVIDWLSLWIHSHDQATAIRPLLGDTVARRLQYPAIANGGWGWAQVASSYMAESPSEVSRVILALVSDGSLMLTGTEEEARLLGRAAKTAPEAVWSQVADRIEAGDWRVRILLRKWFLQSVPVDVIAEWIGESADRARKVASMTDPGTAEPTPLARFLLQRFGIDDRVRRELESGLITGIWGGALSDRIAGQIAQLQGWAPEDTEEEPIKRWANEVIGHLRVDRERALEREAEELW